METAERLLVLALQHRRLSGFLGNHALIVDPLASDRFVDPVGADGCLPGCVDADLIAVVSRAEVKSLRIDASPRAG